MGRDAFFAILCAVVLVLTLKQLSTTISLNFENDSYELDLKSTAKAQSGMFRTCSQNPYLDAIGPVSEITSRMDTWSNNRTAVLTRASRPIYSEHDHARFFPFEPMAECSNISCVGGPCRSDTSKIVCGLEHLQEGCVVYSLGGNNQWEFELDLLAKTPCEIHTFDCTGDRSRFTVPQNQRLHFHHICLSAYPQVAEDKRPEGMVGDSWTLLEMQRRLNHSRIDLLKIDIEGHEHPVLESWPGMYSQKESENILLPMQILIEVHYLSSFFELNRRPDRLVLLQAHLLQMGYVVAIKDDNEKCLHCTELTLIRIRCPGTGVYASQI